MISEHFVPDIDPKTKASEKHRGGKIVYILKYSIFTNVEYIEAKVACYGFLPFGVPPNLAKLRSFYLQFLI